MPVVEGEIEKQEGEREFGHSGQREPLHQSEAGRICPLQRPVARRADKSEGGRECGDGDTKVDEATVLIGQGM